jgi:hypothetical protein
MKNKIVSQRFFSKAAKDNNNIIISSLKPKVKYMNADSDKVNIFTDNRNKIGIYRWINNLNGKTYVGSSNNLSVRFYTYYSLRSLAKSNRPMERALLKYGFSNFSLEILEYCNLDNLLEREQYYLDNLKPDYNIVETAGSTLGYKHTEDSIKKMRDFILSDEVLARKRLATKNATSSKRISILVKNIKIGKLREYKSLTDAAHALKVSKAAVSQALLKKRILKKVYQIIKKEI